MIETWFGSNKFKLLVEYCRQRGITYVDELSNVNFDELINIKGIGKTKIDLIKKKYSEYLNLYDANEDMSKKFIENNTRKLSLEDILHSTPFFSNVSEFSFSSDNLTTLKVDHLLDNLLIPERAKHILQIAKIATIGEILKLTPTQLMKIRNCGKTTILELQESISDYILNNDKDLSNSWIDFESMINSVIKLKPKKMEILKLRLGIDTDKALTLQEIGKVYNLTRERIRQILKSIFDKLGTVEIKQKLEPFWLSIDLVLEQYNGMVSTKTISNEIDQLLQWKTVINENALFNFINNSGGYLLDKEFHLVCSNKKCTNCDQIYFALKSMLSKKLKISFIEVVAILQEHFSYVDCSYYKKDNTFDIPFIQYIINKFNTDEEEIFYDNDYIYEQNYWKETNKGISEKIEDLLLIEGKALHYTKIENIIRSKIIYDFGKRQIVSILNNSKNIFLWDRGTYIHKDNVNVSDSLLEQILDYIELELKNKLPLMHISGIYDKFKKKCLSNNIPSYSALYVLLRNKKRVSVYFPYYPTIYLRETYECRKPLTYYIDRYLEGKNKPILKKDLNNYFIKKIGVKDYSLQQAVSASENVILIGKNKIAHKNCVQNLNRINITQASNNTKLFRKIIFEAQQTKKIEINSQIYLSFTNFKEIIYVKATTDNSNPELLKYQLFESLLHVEYENSQFTWDSQTIIEPEWIIISEDLIKGNETADIIICKNNQISVEDIEFLVFNIKKNKALKLDYDKLTRLNLSKNQNKLIAYLIENKTSSSFLKCKLFCRQNNIEFPQIIHSINEKSKSINSDELVISENRKLLINENYLK